MSMTTRGEYRNFEKDKGGGMGGALRVSEEGGPTMVGGDVTENFQN